MITTQGLWLIVVLTPLILILGVILKRLAILIVMVRHPNLFKPHPNQTSTDATSHRWQGYTVEGSRSWEDENITADVTHLTVNEAYVSNNTGFSPSGVSYLPAEREKRSLAPRLKPRKRRRIG